MWRGAGFVLAHKILTRPTSRSICTRVDPPHAHTCIAFQAYIGNWKKTSVKDQLIDIFLFVNQYVHSRAFEQN